jgi:hypothetical protein
MAINVQPICGASLTAEGPAFTRTLNWVIAACGFIGGAISAITVAGKVVETVQTASQLLSFLFGWSSWAVGGALAAAGGALLGSAIGLGIVLSKGIDRLQGRPGANRCYGGVVNGIALAFSSGRDWAFPYASQHNRVDVVVKRIYWPLVDAMPRQFVWCATDARRSALIRSYFRTAQVNNAAGGAIAGAAVGAVGGAIAGYFAGVGVAAAIGSAACSASLWFYLICLVVVIVVALIVALICTLVTATIGGAIGAGATSSTGSGAAPQGQGGGSISLGDYITLNANLTVYGEDNDAWVAWWVDETAIPPALHGSSPNGEGAGGAAPFNFVDADDGFVDACPL